MNTITNTKLAKRIKRHKRIRAKVYGTAERPRLSVSRSHKCVRAQLIDDTAGTTLAAASDIGRSDKTKTDRAYEVGSALAKEAKQKNITSVVFDRGGFIYTGRVAALARGARDGGLTF